MKSKEKIQQMIKNLFIFLSLLVIPFASCSSSKNVQCRTEIYETHPCSNIYSNKIKINYDDSNIELKHRGEIKLTKNDMAIASISPGGYLFYSKKTFGNTRSIRVDSDMEGKLNYEYKVNKSEVSYEPEGRIWLSEVLTEIARFSGIDVEGRTQRIYENYGFDMVLEEIDEINRSSIKSEYFKYLLNMPELKKEEMIEAIEFVPVKIMSNNDCSYIYRNSYKTFLYDKETTSALLRSVSKLASNTARGSLLRKLNNSIKIEDKDVCESYFNVVKRMESNTEQGSVLRDLVNKRELNDNATIEYCNAAARIASNTIKSDVLQSLEKINFSNSNVSNAFFSAANKITSSTELGHLLRDVYDDFELNKQSMTEYFYTVRKIASNSELGLTMRHLKNVPLKNRDIRLAYFSVVNTISSNTEKGWVLRDLISKQKLDSETQLEFLYATKRLSSNTELGLVLRESIPYILPEDKVISAFLLATGSISSNTERGRVLRELCIKSGLSRTSIEEMITVARKITSNIELSRTLVDIARIIPNDDQILKSKYTEAASTITSATDRNTAMSALK